MQITVVGGGTAGWISALIAKEFLPAVRVVVVESPEIGILGAGEGTTPTFVTDFLDFCRIPFPDLVRHAGATFKNGVRFVNWRGDGSSFFHPFMNMVSKPDLGLFHPDRRLSPTQLDFSSFAAVQALTLLSPRPGATSPVDVERHGAFAAHFNAVRLAAFLKKVALSRGIEHVEGTVTGVIPDASGAIDRLRLQEGGSIGGQLFIDCTGFRRVLLGQHFGVPFVDVSDTLPVDRALPFSLPLDGPRLPLTDAIALDAGWAWKIPVEDRYGCGYVFDSDFQTPDQARETVRTHFGPQVELPRVLRFQAGYLERIWHKNCVAVGLSSGFLEPLEATSIWASLLVLTELFRVHLAQGDDRAHDELNRFHRRLQERIVDFLYLHYLGGRQDTPFWRTFRDRTQAPEVCAEILESGGFRWPFEEDPRIAGHPAPFPAVSWLWVASGLGLMDRDALRRYWDYYALWDGFEGRAKEHQQRLRNLASRCIPHESMLERLSRV